MSYSLRQRRLDRSIQAFQKELDRRKASMDKTDPELYSNAHQLLQDAKKACEKNYIEEGWHYFKQAHRIGLYGLSEKELESEVESLKAEVKKKLESSWRQKAAEALLDKAPFHLAYLIYAMAMRDEHADNQYFKISLTVQQLGVWAVSLFITVSFIAVLLFTLFDRTLPLGELWPPNIMSWKNLEGGTLAQAELRSSSLISPMYHPYELKIVCLVFLFGALGATFSVCLSLLRSPDKSPIPEQLLTRYFTMTRPLLGGVAAVVIYIALHSELIKVSGFNKSAVIWTLSFFSGFTDTLIMKVAGTVGKKVS